MSDAAIRVYDDGQRLHLQWFVDDSTQWRQVLADFKATFRARCERRYDSATRSWSAPWWCQRRLYEWADYWFDRDDQQWEAEEPEGRTYGSRAYGETRSSDERDGTTRAGPSTVEAAFATLHLLPTAPAWAAEAVYKAAIKVYHPDAGGDAQAMTLINGAMERVRRELEHRAS